MKKEATETNQKINLGLDTSELNAHQVRLLKSIHSMLVHVSVTEDEGHYFDGSAELMRMVASLIQQANFNKRQAATNTIPYADQAIEYSMDLVTEALEGRKVIHWDN